MRYVAVFAVAALAASAAGAVAQDAKLMTLPDFSGEWVMNLEKSRFEVDGEGRQRSGNPVSMRVKQDGKELIVTRVRRVRDGEEVKTILTYSLKGKKTKNKTEFGTMESTAKWIEEGTALELRSTTEVKRQGVKVTIESVQTWTLAGGVLTIDTIRYTPRGEIESTAVYERTGAQSAGERDREEKETE